MQPSPSASSLVCVGLRRLWSSRHPVLIHEGAAYHQTMRGPGLEWRIWIWPEASIFPYLTSAVKDFLTQQAEAVTQTSRHLRLQISIFPHLATRVRQEHSIRLTNAYITHDLSRNCSPCNGTPILSLICNSRQQGTASHFSSLPPHLCTPISHLLSGLTASQDPCPAVSLSRNLPPAVPPG